MAEAGLRGSPRDRSDRGNQVEHAPSGAGVTSRGAGGVVGLLQTPGKLKVGSGVATPPLSLQPPAKPIVFDNRIDVGLRNPVLRSSGGGVHGTRSRARAHSAGRAPEVRLPPGPARRKCSGTIGRGRGTRGRHGHGARGRGSYCAVARGSLLHSLVQSR